VYKFPPQSALVAPTNKPPLVAAADPQGNLYFADRAMKRILKYGKDGLFIDEIGSSKLEAPQSLVVDGKGNIYVIDAGRLKVIRRKAGEPAPTANTTN
jgi:sugar lactone lactonase YvrE